MTTVPYVTGMSRLETSTTAAFQFPMVSASPVTGFSPPVNLLGTSLAATSAVFRFQQSIGNPLLTFTSSLARVFRSGGLLEWAPRFTTRLDQLPAKITPRSALLESAQIVYPRPKLNREPRSAPPENKSSLVRADSLERLEPSNIAPPASQSAAITKPDSLHFHTPDNPPFSTPFALQAMSTASKAQDTTTAIAPTTLSIDPISAQTIVDSSNVTPAASAKLLQDFMADVIRPAVLSRAQDSRTLRAAIESPKTSSSQSEIQISPAHLSVREVYARIKTWTEKTPLGDASSPEMTSVLLTRIFQLQSTLALLPQDASITIADIITFLGFDVNSDSEKLLQKSVSPFQYSRTEFTPDAEDNNTDHIRSFVDLRAAPPVFSAFAESELDQPVKVNPVSESGTDAEGGENDQQQDSKE